MRRHKRILVAVDGSETGFNALSESIQLARWNRGAVTALITSAPYEGDLNLLGVGRIRETVFGGLEQTLNQVLDFAESNGVRIETVCRQGEMCEELAAMARSLDSDLVVLGVNDKASFLRLLVGDTVFRLLRLLAGSSSDVLVIPEGTALAWERILFITTEADIGSTVSDRVIETAASCGGSMIIMGISCGCLCSYGESLHAEEKSSTSAVRDYLEEICAKAHEAGVVSETILRRGGVPEVVGKAVKEFGIDVIFSASRGRIGFKGLWTGESLERVIYNCSRPVLVLADG